jgi:hypothetical protein
MLNKDWGYLKVIARYEINIAHTSTLIPEADIYYNASHFPYSEINKVSSFVLQHHASYLNMTSGSNFPQVCKHGLTFYIRKKR